mgnify:CR=1 FL=1
MLADLLPAATSSPALAGLTLRRGTRNGLIAYRDGLRLLRERREAVLPLLDERAAEAHQAALTARLEVATIDGQLAAIEAALATPEAVA